MKYFLISLCLISLFVSSTMNNDLEEKALILERAIERAEKRHKEEFTKKILYIFNKYNSKFTVEEKDKIIDTLYGYEKNPNIKIPADMFLAIACTETNFDNNAIGSCGEITCVQFMKKTWYHSTKEDYYKGAEKNIEFVIKTWYEYFGNLNNYFGEDENNQLKSVLAYNCGRWYSIKTLKNGSAIEKFKNGIYGSNTKSYDEKVFGYYEEFKNINLA